MSVCGSDRLGTVAQNQLGAFVASVTFREGAQNVMDVIDSSNLEAFREYTAGWLLGREQYPHWPFWVRDSSMP